jgi:ABC-type dipeptide/oligopeptide/nickel transport system permease component
MLTIPTTKTIYPRMKKLLLHFAVLFFLLTIGFIYFTMMPNDIRRRRTMAEFSTARAFTQVQTHAKTSLCGL